MDTTVAIILSVLVMGGGNDDSSKSVTYEKPPIEQHLIHASSNVPAKLQQTRKRIALTNQWLKNNQLKRKQLAYARIKPSKMHVAQAIKRSCSPDWKRT